MARSVVLRYTNWLPPPPSRNVHTTPSPLSSHHCRGLRCPCLASLPLPPGRRRPCCLAYHRSSTGDVVQCTSRRALTSFPPLLHTHPPQVAQAMLSDVWRWRRRGGGMDDETDRPNYAVALEELQVCRGAFCSSNSVQEQTVIGLCDDHSHGPIT